MSEHTLKVVPPYFEAIADGSKTFEVRKNDRAYQKGDVLRLREWHPYRDLQGESRCGLTGCHAFGASAHWGPGIVVVKTVEFVYSGDPRFGGIEPGYVVLGLAEAASGTPEPTTTETP